MTDTPPIPGMIPGLLTPKTDEPDQQELLKILRGDDKFPYDRGASFSKPPYFTPADVTRLQGFFIKAFPGMPYSDERLLLTLWEMFGYDDSDFVCWTHDQYSFFVNAVSMIEKGCNPTLPKESPIRWDIKVDKPQQRVTLDLPVNMYARLSLVVAFGAALGLKEMNTLDIITNNVNPAFMQKRKGLQTMRFEGHGLIADMHELLKQGMAADGSVTLTKAMLKPLAKQNTHWLSHLNSISPEGLHGERLTLDEEGNLHLSATRAADIERLLERFIFVGKHYDIQQPFSIMQIPNRYWENLAQYPQLSAFLKGIDGMVQLYDGKQQRFSYSAADGQAEDRLAAFSSIVPGIRNHAQMKEGLLTIDAHLQQKLENWMHPFLHRLFESGDLAAADAELTGRIEGLRQFHERPKNNASDIAHVARGVEVDPQKVALDALMAPLEAALSPSVKLLERLESCNTGDAVNKLRPSTGARKLYFHDITSAQQAVAAIEVLAGPIKGSDGHKPHLRLEADEKNKHRYWVRVSSELYNGSLQPVLQQLRSGMDEVKQQFATDADAAVMLRDIFLAECREKGFAAGEHAQAASAARGAGEALGK